ncbi:hypothetical protein TBR22_A20210 [Luteitalea sp. TBR-22]|nr:hypothetical protein TBR22_A20210 [Luteitalea sp. TBR-22]
MGGAYPDAPARTTACMARQETRVTEPMSPSIWSGPRLSKVAARHSAAAPCPCNRNRSPEPDTARASVPDGHNSAVTGVS